MSIAWACPTPREKIFQSLLEIGPCFSMLSYKINNCLQWKKWNFSSIPGKWRISYFQGHFCDNSGFEWRGKIRGYFAISEETSAHRQWAVVIKQTAVFGSAPFQGNGSNPDTWTGQKAGLFNHLDTQATTAAVGGTCHSQFAKDSGPDACPGRTHS